MESWSAEEDHFSFLHTAPLSFSLRHQEGPNRVEIFDITNIPSPRSAISETTCLCDIFGDECESPALSSSPASGSLFKREEDEFALVNDTANDSSGSYHTAPCSEQLSDSSGTYEDTREDLTPVPPVTPLLPEDRSETPSPKSRGTPPSPEHKGNNISPEPGPAAAPPEVQCASEARSTTPSPKPKCTTPAESKDITPLPSVGATSFEPGGTDQSPKLRDTSASPEARESNTSPEPRATAASPELKSTSPSPDPRCTAPSPKPNNIAPSPEHKGRLPSPEPRGTDLSPEPRAIVPLAETRDTDLYTEDRVAPPSPNPRGGSPSPKSRAITPSSEPSDFDCSLKPKDTVNSAEPRSTDPFPESISTTLSPKPRTISPTLQTGITDATPEPTDTDISELQNTLLSHESQDIEPSSEVESPALSIKSKSPDLLSELKDPKAEYSDTAVLLEPLDTDLSLKSTEPWDKDREMTTATLANKGLHSPQPWFTSEAVLIRPSGNQQKEENTHRGPSENEAPEDTEPVSGLLNPREDSVTSRESPTESPGSGSENRGEGKQGKASYGEQQVELSFSARNRKAPASPNSAPTYREPRSGMPARCYSDCHLVTQQQQQQQQQQNLLRVQKENQVRARKPQPVPQANRSSGSRSVPDCSSETSSMGSELDEADNEVKWFTDLAFRSLSSPQADYLDVYNSSHRSSTNVSQLSTEESPGANAWSAYADLRGSTRHESDDLSHQLPVALPPDGLDTARRFEMGSFECVDVALESREEVRKGKRTVPKRQIQLKRRDTSESRASENSEVTAEATSAQRRSRDTFLRQHSTPAAMQEELYRKELESDPGNRKQKLQKSLSLEETSSKNKMASCLIKSVLSKKMQNEHKLTNTQVPFQNGHSSPPPVRNVSSESSQSVRETPKTEVSNLSSGITSDCSLSSEDLPLRADSSPQSESIKQHGTFGFKPQQKPLCKPSYSPPHSNTGRAESQKSNPGHSGMRSELVIPFESKKTEKRTPADGGKQQASHNPGEKHASDSANASAGNTGTAATRAQAARSGMTNRDEECHARPENYKQQSARSLFMSKTPEITLKPCPSREKKMSSFKVGCLSADLETKPEESRGAPSPEATPEREKQDEKVEPVLKEQTENEEANEKSKAKAPMHKIECKAISRRDERAASSQADERQTTQEEKTQTAPSVSPSLASPEKMRETASLRITSRSCLSEGVATAETRVKTPEAATVEVSTPCVSDSGDRAEKAQGAGARYPKLGSIPKHPSKDREVATLLFLQDGMPEGVHDPMAPPPLSLTATSSSRSVSMLLKEKGFQADIGVCDAPGDGPNAAPKHINRLEVPLQTCSTEQTPAEPQREEGSDSIPPPARSSPSGPVPLTDMRDELHQKAPPQTREPEPERTSLKPKQRDTKPQDITESSMQKAAVSAASSYSMQQREVTTVSSYTKKPAVEATSGSQQQQSPTTTTQPPSYTQKPTVSATCGNADQPSVSATSSYRQKPAASSNPQQSNMERRDTQEQVSSCGSERSTVSMTTQAPSYSQQQAIRTISTQRTPSEDFRFYASDDPPSYDERESFSPLLLTDLPPRKMDRYHPIIPAPPCSCTADSIPSPGPAPPASPPSSAQAPPSHTQAPPSHTAPAAARPHQKRSDAHSLSHQQGSPQAAQPSSAQPPLMFQPLHQPPGLPAGPAPLQQPRPEDGRQPPPGPQADRRVPRHRSPQQPAPLPGGGPYSGGHHGHSPGVPSLEVRPQYLCSPQGFVSSFGSEYGGESGGSSGVLYPEGGGGLAYGQSPRRVLLDPETGKYFYIEVPVQPLRKMLFDPETGQYVEVLIPQQALSHSGLYPPVAAPYHSLHNPGMYAPQYLPYGVPPHPQAPSPRHPEPPAAPGLHQSSAGFGSPAGQGAKPEPQSHAPLDQSYLESMYYIPTGMTASPNPAPPDFYHKLPPSLPNSGGKRS
ncbi:uncharacterized protein C4orf54 homolog [Megalops cyprinoides]|uniref:uncharacterized protein C4orf54 homolog n=1 Tax=Megalops cyprinoides TaxID=118141 RepID=UPI00186487ED|nr:uncharacterized protein C4orf54 homolog [Megalops cyprinoides]